MPCECTECLLGLAICKRLGILGLRVDGGGGGRGGRGGWQGGAGWQALSHKLLSATDAYVLHGLKLAHRILFFSFDPNPFPFSFTVSRPN